MTNDLSKIHVSEHAIRRFRERNEAARSDTDQQIVDLIKNMVKDSKQTEPVRKLKLLSCIRNADKDPSKKYHYRRFYTWVMVMDEYRVITIHKNNPGEDWK